MFVLDKSTMFRIENTKNNQPYKHHVKPLHVIWSKLTQYNNTNTLHVDDLQRNFALNPLNGIQCTPYKNCETAHQTDNELLYITRYCQYLATHTNDVLKYDNTNWRTVLKQLAPNE